MRRAQRQNRAAEFVLSEADVQTLFSACGLRDRTLLELLYYSALRRAEAIGLDVPDVDFNRNLVRVRQGKGAKERFVPLRALPRVQGGEMTVLETHFLDGTIADIIKKMIKYAKGSGFTVRQVLNGVTVLVDGDSNADLIIRDQRRAQRGYIGGEVGPYPKATLTPEDKENDARVEDENTRRVLRQWDEYVELLRARREQVEAKLAGTPAIVLADKEGWQRAKNVNTDGLGTAVFAYAERWARLMQIELAGGKSLEAVVEATALEADLENISGSMYGCAASLLMACWQHGEQLRRALEVQDLLSRWRTRASSAMIEGGKADNC